MDSQKARNNPITDAGVRRVFRDAGDFIAREITCGEFILYAYAIDGSYVHMDVE